MGRLGMDGWFVIQTNPQSERKASDELRRAGLRVYLPKRSYEVRDRFNHSNPVVRWKPLLIGYLFIRFPGHLIDRWGMPQFGVVRGCQGVKGYLKTMNEQDEWEPFCVPDQAVAAFMRRQRQREFGRPNVPDPKKRLADMRKRFHKGRSVRVTDGPFATFLATLEKFNSDYTIDVSLDIFGRPTKVRLDVVDVEPVSETLDAIRDAA
jgi:transcription antitermination factor NusG